MTTKLISVAQLQRDTEYARHTRQWLFKYIGSWPRPVQEESLPPHLTRFITAYNHLVARIWPRIDYVESAFMDVAVSLAPCEPPRDLAIRVRLDCMLQPFWFCSAAYHSLGAMVAYLDAWLAQAYSLGRLDRRLHVRTLQFAPTRHAATVALPHETTNLQHLHGSGWTLCDVRYNGITQLLVWREDESELHAATDENKDACTSSFELGEEGKRVRGRPH
jgi:hypothetical protein